MADPAAATVIDLYQRHGRAWATLRTRELVEVTWVDGFCALLPVAASVLDIGCGSGKPIAVELVQRGYAVTGVDGAPTMIDLFRANLPGVPVHLQDMRQLSLGRRFAGLIAWDSFFHLTAEDQRGMFRLFEAHAAPGAALMFTSGPAEQETIGLLEQEPLYHGSLNPAEYRTLLDRAGFDVVRHVAEDASCGGRTVWLAQRRGG